MSTPLAPFAPPAPPGPGGAGLDPGTPADAAHLRQLLRAALPDKGRHKAAGWWAQTDFLLTRSHVDEDGDAFHDGLFITVWKRWDFWLALPDTAPPPAGHWAARAWARLRTAPDPQATGGLVRQWRAYGGDGQPGDWQRLDDTAPAAAQQAFAQAWRDVLDYWRAAEQERRAGWPLRRQLHAALTRQRVAALIALPLLTGRAHDWADPERAGRWLGDVWVGARAAGGGVGGQHAPALKLGWRNGQEGPGDPEDDAHACYQIELHNPQDAPAPGTAHPPGLALSYSQRQSDPRVPLPGHAALHLGALLRLFTQAEQRLHAASEHERARALAEAGDTPAPALARLPPYAPHDSDADVLGPAVMALSRDWQAAARAHAAAVRAQWSAPAAPDAPAAVLPHDPRALQAPAVLQLARAVHAVADADLSERFHHRFAFAPAAYAAHAARHGQHVQALRWLPQGTLLAWVRGSQGVACWHIDPAGLHPRPADPASDPDTAGLPEPATACATVHGTTVRGDAHGDLHGWSEDDHPLWRHHVGGAVLCLAASDPEGEPLLAVGTQAGYLVLLKKAAGPDALLPSTSRYHELRRLLFWDDAPAPLAW